MSFYKAILHVHKTPNVGDGTIRVAFTATDGGDALNPGHIEQLLNELLPHHAALALKPVPESQINKGMTKYDDEILEMPAVKAAAQNEPAQLDGKVLAVSTRKALVTEWRKQHNAEEPAYTQFYAIVPVKDEALMDTAVDGLRSHYQVLFDRGVASLKTR